MSELVFESMVGPLVRTPAVHKERDFSSAVSNSPALQRLRYQQIEVRPVSYPYYRRLGEQWRHRVWFRRFCQDDHNHIVRLPWGDWRYRPLAQRKPQSIAMGALLRLIVAEVREFHDYGQGIGYLAQLLGAMRDFSGVARIITLEPGSAEAAERVAGQLGLLHRLRIHGPVERSVERPMEPGEVPTPIGAAQPPPKLATMARPEVMRLDLDGDPRLIPLEINEIIAAARPLILLSLPQQSAQLERSLSWLFGNGYRLYSMGVSPGRSEHSYDLHLDQLALKMILNHESPLPPQGHKNLLAVPEENEQRWLQR
ncbi:MAG: hypothetical protein ORO03_09985 [Alphaproteobacteria bacterium]|nr:hypothetical protein [Alphaproteobacteria bacterium]